MTGEHDEATKYVLWINGRLEELREAGLVNGEGGLTEQGRREFRTLKAQGFRPDPDLLREALEAIEIEPADLFAALILTGPTPEDKP